MPLALPPCAVRPDPAALALAAAAPVISQDAMLSLEQDAQAYLVRQLDIALNGEAAAAR